MSFSDPFNRVSCRQESDYQKFQQQLQSLGIDAEHKVLELLHRSRRNLLGLGLLVVLLGVVSMLIWPQVAAIVMVFCVLSLLWLSLTWMRGEKLMKRYLRQSVVPGNQE